MKKIIVKGLFLILLMFIGISNLKSQDTVVQLMYTDKISFGVGMGLDNGGFGGSLLFYPIHQVGIFLGIGYPIAGIGYNTGIKFRLTKENSTQKFIPYLTAMYGYNAAIAVSGATQYNKLFYGPTLGFGFDMKTSYFSKGYWTLGICIPFRSSEVDDYMDDLETNHGVEFKNSLPPIAVSFAYRFIIK